jgi:hypothetical protein
VSSKRRWCGSGCDSFSVDGGIRANWKRGEDAHEDGGDWDRYVDSFEDGVSGI